MAVSTIKMPNEQAFKQATLISSRAGIINGGYTRMGYLIFVNMKIKTISTGTNSPQVATLPSPRTDCALSCIDITNGMGTAIESSVPCGISSEGKLYIKSITTDHIYAISGIYIAE